MKRKKNIITRTKLGVNKYPPLHFQNMQKHHKRLLNHTRITPIQQ